MWRCGLVCTWLRCRTVQWTATLKRTDNAQRKLPSNRSDTYENAYNIYKTGGVAISPFYSFSDVEYMPVSMKAVGQRLRFSILSIALIHCAVLHRCIALYIFQRQTINHAATSYVCYVLLCSCTALAASVCRRGMSASLNQTSTNHLGLCWAHSFAFHFVWLTSRNDGWRKVLLWFFENFSFFDLYVSLVAFLFLWSPLRAFRTARMKAGRMRLRQAKFLSVFCDNEFFQTVGRKELCSLFEVSAFSMEAMCARFQLKWLHSLRNVFLTWRHSAFFSVPTVLCNSQCRFFKNHFSVKIHMSAMACSSRDPLSV